MGFYTEYTARWLDRRYAKCTEEGFYYAHMPIYGAGHPACEPGHAVRLARTFQILRTLADLSFESLLDIGGGEGYLAYLVHMQMGARVMSCDLSAVACRRAAELFGVGSIAVDSTRLPFEDNSFDVVVCSEVIEHVEYPIETLLELRRVAKRAVLLTTEEVHFDRTEIDKRLLQRCGYPHAERNIFHPDALRLFFGDGIRLCSQFLPGNVPEDDAPLDRLQSWILEATHVKEISAHGVGALMLFQSSDYERRKSSRHEDHTLLDLLLKHSKIPPQELYNLPVADPDSTILKHCVCPTTKSPLQLEDDILVNAGGRRYPIRYGIPVLYDLKAPDPEADQLDSRLPRGWPSERVRAVHHLRERLLLPVDPAKLSWDFTDQADRRGWMPSDRMEARSGSGFAFTAHDHDPWFASPGLALPASKLACLAIHMRAHNPDYPVEGGLAQVLWLGEEDDALDEARSATVPILNDGVPHTYRIDLRAQPNWPHEGRILFLRIDPANGPCEFEIYSITLLLDDQTQDPQ